MIRVVLAFILNIANIAIAIMIKISSRQLLGQYPAVQWGIFITEVLPKLLIGLVFALLSLPLFGLGQRRLRKKERPLNVWVYLAYYALFVPSTWIIWLFYQSVPDIIMTYHMFMDQMPPQ